MPALTFYPSLATLIPLESIPSELGLLKGGLSNFFDHFFYRDLQIHKSVNGDAAFYSLKLITYKRLALEVPGTGGLALILNPGLNQSIQGASSEFPISVSYKWGILRYAKALDLQTFDWSPTSFFELILDITGATKQELLTEALSVLTDAPDPIQEFIDLFNSNPNNKPVAPLELRSFPTHEEAIADLLMQLIGNDNDFDAYQVILDQYILSINSIDEIFDKLELLFAKWLGAFSIDHIKQLLIPQLSASVDVFSVGIQFPATILREVDAKGKPKPDPQNPSKDKPALLLFDIASLKYSTASGLEFELAESLNINFPKSEILKSGLILELHDVKVDFSRTKNIPEAIADGRPEDFVGVYVKDGTMSVPAFWQHDKAKSTGIIKARNLLIGTGGFSGEFSLEKKTGITTKPLIECKFGDDFSVSLDKFSLTLKMNAIKNSTIEGTLKIPGFKDANKKPAEIRIKVAIRQDGDFDITAHEDDGFKTISCGEIFDLTLKSVFFGKRDEDFYLGVSGTIKFTHDLLAKVNPVEVEKLIIWSDGRFEIEGGTIPLPKNICLPIGPAKLSISAVNMGSHQRINSDGSIRNFRFFGFDGGVDVNPGVLDVQGKGIKFYYPVDLVLADCYLEIKSLAIDLVIPATASKETASLLISGFLSIGGTESDPAWEGGVSFGLPKMKIRGGASMQLRPKVPAFIVDAFVELSTPIPMGGGLGIYGFDGLFGHHYLASKPKVGLQDTDTWFDYYKKPPEGVHTSKFEGPSETKSYDNVFSIGAGVSLADTQNSGETFSCKLFFMLSLPDLIYLEGKANILGPRVGLTGDEEPPFFAVLALTPQSVEMGIGVSYKLPRDGDQKGWILDLNAEMRAAFFFQNSSAWYINFGTIQNPITAQVLSIFHGTAYVMLSAAGIAAGAGVTFGFTKSYAGGLVRASVGVYLKVGGFVSFERPQFGGFAMLGGHVDVSLMWFRFYISIDTSLSVEAPKPFYIQGSVRLCVGVTIGFWKFKKTIHKCFDVEFKWVKNKAIDTTPVLPFADLTKPNALSPTMGTNMLSGESFKVAYLGSSLPSANDSAFNDDVLPLDTWVDIEFLKGLLPAPAVDARIGRLSGQVPANAIDFIPPAEVAHKVKHEYSIKAAEIKAWNGSDWVDYRTYEAMSPPGALNVINANPSVFKDGFWQNSGSGFNKLRLLAETSLSYMQQGQPGWYIPEQFGITSATLFCQTKLREKHCLDWTKVVLGTIYPADAWRQTDTVLFRVSGAPGTVIDWNSHFDKPRSLGFANETSAQIVFNKPCVEVSLKLTTFSSGAVIRFFKRETLSAVFVYTLVETRTLSQLQLLAEVKYNDAANPVAKVEIDPINGDAAAIYALQVQIDGRYRLLNEENRDAKAKDALLAEIHTLEQELERLKGLGGSPNGINEDALIKQISMVKGQVEECRRQAGELQPAQRRACKEAADFRGRFERCFPHTPSQLSFEVVKRPDLIGRVHFQFIVYDDERDAILFNSADSYVDEVSAERAIFETLKLAVWPGDYVLMAPKNGQYFFQLADTSGQFVAVNPGFFSKWDQLLASWKETHTRCRAAQAGGTFALSRRRDGKLPCDESLDHLTCWKELPALVAAGAGKCNAIMAGIQSAREAFCNAYNKLYRELYICNKQVLDQLTGPCDRLTHELAIKQKECQTLNDQLTALVELQAFIDQSGTLIPPKSGSCSTLLHEVCYLPLEDYQFNLSAPGKEAIDRDYQNATDAIREWPPPIWRPDTKYCVRLHVTDTVNDVPSTDNDREFYFGFRTAGPLGHFDSDPFVNYVDKAHGKKPDQYMLTGLKGYIDYARSYPDPSGQLIGAKPLFYEDARILLFFTKRYVHHFFGDWPAYKGLPALTGNAMQIVIKDPAEDTSIPNPPPPDITTTKIPQAVVTWLADDDPRIPEDIRALLNLHNPELLNPDFQGGDCWASGGKMITPASVYTSVVPHYLKPLKLYTAIINNVYQGQIKEVHQFVFRTSRYPDFISQVKSYRLDDGKGNQGDAIFQIETPLSVADLNLMFDVVTGNMSPANLALAVSWADPFDRLVAGVMKLTPLDAAISTEFNIVANGTTGAPVAVWIRNPEPFNDPKLPDDVRERTLRVIDGSQVDFSYQVLFSKDGSQAFVMHTSRVIPVTEMQFRFAYFEWDGSEYVERVVVISDFISTKRFAGAGAATL